MEKTEMNKVKKKKQIWVLAVTVCIIAIGILVIHLFMSKDHPVNEDKSAIDETGSRHIKNNLVVELNGNYCFNVGVDEFQNKYNETLDVNYVYKNTETSNDRSAFELRQLAENSIVVEQVDTVEGKGYYGDIGSLHNTLAVGCYENEETGKICAAGAFF